jgi:hypothetical protein
VAGAGGVRFVRFLAVTVPSALGCIGVVAAIALGYVSVAFASTEPLDLVTTRGAADRMTISLGTDDSVTGMDGPGEPRPVAIVRIGGAELQDLCLVPRVKLPVLGRTLALTISSSRTVRMDSASLGVDRSVISGLTLPRTEVGAALDAGAPGQQGGFGARTVGGDKSVLMEDAHLKVYGLTLDKGLSMRSLGLKPELGDDTC